MNSYVLFVAICIICIIGIFVCLPNKLVSNALSASTRTFLSRIVRNSSSILLSWSSILFSLRLRKLNLRRPFAIAVFGCFLLGFYKRRLKCLLRTLNKFLFTHNIVREQKLFFLENTCAVHFRPVCIYCEANSIIYKCANNCAQFFRIFDNAVAKIGGWAEFQ